MKKTETRKHQNLLQGSLILGVAVLLVKIIGAIYKIPLGWVLGGVGSGYFSIAYDIYLPIFSIAMTGLPVAISRLVAESVSEGRFRDTKRILKVSKRLFLIVGLVCFAILAAAIPIYIKYIDEPNAFWPMMAIAPSLIFCCIMSTYRGYYEGLRNMYPTAFSQVIEALGKLGIGLVLAYVAKIFLTNEFIASGTILGREVVLDGSTATLAEVANKMMMPYVASCAILGITLGSVFGALYLVIRHKVSGDKITKEELEASPEPQSSKSYLKMLVLIAIPIVLGSLTTQIASLVDLTIVKVQLKSLMETDAEAVRACYGEVLSGLTNKDIPTFLYGCYRNYAHSLYNLAPTITSVIGVSAIPIIATAWKSKDRLAVKENLESSIRVTSLIAFPAGVGLFVLSSQVLSLLYPNNVSEVAVSSPILQVLGITSIFVAITIPETSMLQAIGKQKIPVYNMLVGVVLKVMINYFLVAIPELNIVGAPVGTAVCYAYIFTANLIALRKYSEVKINILSTIIKPLLSALICGVAAYGTNLILTSWRGKGSLTTIISVAAAGVAYILALGFTKTITKNDVTMLPKGQKIAKILEKIGWLG